MNTAYSTWMRPEQYDLAQAFDIPESDGALLVTCGEAAARRG
jgi:hypothetical protein